MIKRLLPAVAVAIALIPPAVGHADDKSELVALFATTSYAVFGSQALIARNGPVTTASIIIILDPPPENGAVIVSGTQWIDCAKGLTQLKEQVDRKEDGTEISRKTFETPASKPGAGTMGEAIFNYVCSGRLVDAKSARYPSVEAAIPGARAILARARAQAGGK